MEKPTEYLGDQKGPDPSSSPTRTYLKYKSQYDEDGFVVVPQFVESRELKELNEEIERFIREVVPRLPDGQTLYYRRANGTVALRHVFRMNCDPYFEAYRSHPLWNALATCLVGERVRANPPVWLNKPTQSNHPTPPHQDVHYYCLEPPNFVMIFLALERIDRENGCVRYVRRSHLRGKRPHTLSTVRGFSQTVTDFGESDLANSIAVELDPGDAVCHHGYTIHWAGENMSTTRSRRAMHMTFIGESCRVNEGALAEYERGAQRSDILK